MSLEGFIQRIELLQLYWDNIFLVVLLGVIVTIKTSPSPTDHQSLGTHQRPSLAHNPCSHRPRSERRYYDCRFSIDAKTFDRVSGTRLSRIELLVVPSSAFCCNKFIHNTTKPWPSMGCRVHNRSLCQGCSTNIIGTTGCLLVMSLDLQERSVGAAAHQISGPYRRCNSSPTSLRRPRAPHKETVVATNLGH